MSLQWRFGVVLTEMRTSTKFSSSPLSIEMADRSLVDGLVVYAKPLTPTQPSTLIGMEIIIIIVIIIIIYDKIRGVTLSREITASGTLYSKV